MHPSLKRAARIAGTHEPQPCAAQGVIMRCPGASRDACHKRGPSAAACGRLWGCADGQTRAVRSATPAGFPRDSWPVLIEFRGRFHRNPKRMCGYPLYETAELRQTGVASSPVHARRARAILELIRTSNEIEFPGGLIHEVGQAPVWMIVPTCSPRSAAVSLPGTRPFMICTRSSGELLP